MTPAERFLATARRERADATPVWFMRQAGRCLPGYRKLRERYSFLELAKIPDLCARVTVMPVDVLDVDGAVIYADIMLPLGGMGVPFEIKPEVGPIIHQPVRSMADVERLHPLEPEESVGYVAEALRLVSREVAPGRAAVIGFAGAPFTLACYLVEGKPSRDYARAKSLMLREPAVWAALMDRLSDSLVRYVEMQVAAGAQVVQVFDSWVGALGPADFRCSVLPWMERIFAALRRTGVPTIYFGTGNAALLPDMARAGSDILSVDWRVDLADAWAAIGHDRGIQGNLDPVRPLAGWEPAREGAEAVLRAAGERPGHIFNLGHGVLPETDPDVLRRLVDFVHERTGGGR